MVELDWRCPDGGHTLRDFDRLRPEFRQECRPDLANSGRNQAKVGRQHSKVGRTRAEVSPSRAYSGPISSRRWPGVDQIQPKSGHHADFRRVNRCCKFRAALWPTLKLQIWMARNISRWLSKSVPRGSISGRLPHNVEANKLETTTRVDCSPLLSQRSKMVIVPSL